MSVENVKAFFEKLQGDRGLKDQLRKGLESAAGDPDKAGDVLIKIAGSAGHTFTSEHVAEVRKEKVAAGELTEDQLDTVAGGQPCDRCRVPMVYCGLDFE